MTSEPATLGGTRAVIATGVDAGTAAVEAALGLERDHEVAVGVHGDIGILHVRADEAIDAELTAELRCQWHQSAGHRHW